MNYWRTESNYKKKICCRKFERNVQYTGQLQEKVNAVAEEKSKAEDLLKQQELRYDKMKSHTMQQFDM